VGRYWDLVEYTAYAVEFRYGTLDLSDKPLHRPNVIHQVQNLFDSVNRLIAKID
jgi:hypothetical protein